MKSTVFITIALFIILSVVYLQISSAPLKVHSINICSFFIAFVLGTFAAECKWLNLSKIEIWAIFSIIGLVVFDVLSAFVIVKREMFDGWFVIYHFGMTGLLLLQLLASFVGVKVAYNKARKQDK